MLIQIFAITCFVAIFEDFSELAAARIGGLENFTLTCEKEVLYTPPKIFKDVAIEKDTGKRLVVRNGSVRSRIRLESNGLLWLLTETPLEMRLLNRESDLSESQVAQGQGRSDVRNGKSGRISAHTQALPEDSLEFALGLRLKGASGRIPASFWRGCQVALSGDSFDVEWRVDIPQANGTRIHKWRFRNSDGLPLENYLVLWQEGSEVFPDVEVMCSEFSVVRGVAIPTEVRQREHFARPGLLPEISKTVTLSNLKCQLGNASVNSDSYQATWLPDSYIHDERSSQWIHVAVDDVARKIPDQAIGGIQIAAPRNLVRTPIVVASIVTVVFLSVVTLVYARRHLRLAARETVETQSDPAVR